MSYTTLEGNKEFDQFFIKFYPSFSKKLGTSNANLVFSRLEYWFSRMGKTFYKFLEPCEDHPLYKEGDSWEEEIGLKRKAFNKAFSKIGNKFKSKSEFDKVEDPFQGKLYACYYDRKTNKTYYVRNDTAVEKVYNDIQTPHAKPSKKQQFAKNKDLSSHKGRSCNGPSGRSFTRARDKDKQINTPSPYGGRSHSQNSVSAFCEKSEKRVGDIINIWENIIGPIEQRVSSSTKKKALESFKSYFNSSIEEWTTYCTAILSSKFLMGEANNDGFKKAWFSWAITEKAIEKVRGGEFILGNRLDTLNEKISDLKSGEKEKKSEKTNNLLREAEKLFWSSGKEKQEEIKTNYEADLSYLISATSRAQKQRIEKYGWELLEGFGIESDLFRSDFKRFLVKHFKLDESTEKGGSVDPKEGNPQLKKLEEERERLLNFNADSFFKRDSLFSAFQNRCELQEGRGLQSTIVEEVEVSFSEQEFAEVSEELGEKIFKEKREKAKKIWDSCDESKKAYLRHEYEKYVQEADPIGLKLLKKSGWGNETVQILFEHFVSDLQPNIPGREGWKNEL